MPKDRPKVREQCCTRCGAVLWIGQPEYRQGRIVRSHVVCPPRRLIYISRWHSPVPFTEEQRLIARSVLIEAIEDWLYNQPPSLAEIQMAQ